MLRIIYVIIYAILIVSPAYSAPSHETSQLGLYVSEQGVLQRNGIPYTGIGVNYFDVFYRVLKNNNDTSYKKGFKELSSLEIPFVRFMASGFWPNDMKLYRKNPKLYFSLMDEIVASAEKNKIGLIPSLFWNYAMVPDLVGESMNQWGNTKSKTHQFMRKYTQELVSRYKNSPAIWGWEFGNEMNLQVDLPNAAKQRPAIVPDRGTPASRSHKDELSAEHMVVALGEFAKVVRQIDRRRMLSSGNSMPRASAYHNSHEKSWKVDSKAQTQKILKRDNPPPINTISIHFYAGNPFFERKKTEYSRFIENLVDVAKVAKKPVFIGEFGLCNGMGIAQSKISGEFKQLLAVMKEARIPLAALWVYDLKSQKNTCNVTFTNTRSYQLKAIAISD